VFVAFTSATVSIMMPPVIFSIFSCHIQNNNNNDNIGGQFMYRNLLEAWFMHENSQCHMPCSVYY
jgi:hypothetical protein